MENIISIEPAVNGMVKLSSSGVGRHSTSMPAIAAIKALIGSTKKTAPEKANIKPKMEPSRFLALLNGYGVFPNFLPNKDAAPSPNVSMAIEAYPKCGGKIISESIMPKA